MDLVNSSFLRVGAQCPQNPTTKQQFAQLPLTFPACLVGQTAVARFCWLAVQLGAAATENWVTAAFPAVPA